MDELRDFLLDRIAEEEALAQAAIDAHETDHSWATTEDADGAHFARWSPWRVLAGSVSKRLIVAAHRDVGAGVDRRAEPDRMVKTHVCSTCGQYDEYAIEWPCYTLKVLALDWVDHPAYRPEWRPQRLSSGVGRAPAASASRTVPPNKPPNPPVQPPLTRPVTSPGTSPVTSPVSSPVGKTMEASGSAGGVATAAAPVLPSASRPVPPQPGEPAA